MNSKYKTNENGKAKIGSCGSSKADSRDRTSVNNILSEAPSTSKRFTRNSYIEQKRNKEKEIKTEMVSQLISQGQEYQSGSLIGNIIPIANSTMGRYSQSILKQEKDRDLQIETTIGSEIRYNGQLPSIRRPLTYAAIKGRRPIRTLETPNTPTVLKIPKTPKTLRVPKAPNTPKTPKASKSSRRPATPKTPMTPKTAETSKTSKTLRIKKVSETSNSPKTPDTPNTPKASKSSKIPRTLKVTETFEASPKLNLRSCGCKRARIEDKAKAEMDQRNVDNTEGSSAPKRACIAIYGLDIKSPLSMLRRRNIRRFIFDANESIVEQFDSSISQVAVDNEPTDVVPLVQENQNDNLLNVPHPSEGGDASQILDQPDEDATSRIEDEMPASPEENALILEENDDVLESKHSTSIWTFNHSAGGATLTLEYSAVDHNSHVHTTSERSIEIRNTSFTHDIESQLTPAILDTPATSTDSHNRNCIIS